MVVFQIGLRYTKNGQSVFLISSVIQLDLSERIERHVPYRQPCAAVQPSTRWAFLVEIPAAVPGIGSRISVPGV